MSDNNPLFPALLAASPAPKGTEPKVDEKSPEKVPEKEPERPNELAMLKRQADVLGVPYSNNIGAETLAKKIKDAMSDETRTTVPDSKTRSEQEEEDEEPPEQAPRPERPMTKQEKARQLREEYMKLVRVRITNMDPKKADLKGEVLTVSNNFLGKVSKFVPYGEFCGEDGYHVPYILYLFMKERKFSQVKTDLKSGVPRALDVAEFSIELLPQHTEKSLKKLAMKQAAASGTTEAGE